MSIISRIFGASTSDVDFRTLHQCTACGEFTCHDAECVRREYKMRAQRVLMRLRERNDGQRVMISLSELDDLIESIDMHWRPYRANAQVAASIESR